MRPNYGAQYMPYQQVDPTMMKPEFGSPHGRSPHGRTYSGGLQSQQRISPALLPLYVVLMLALPILVFLFGFYTQRRQMLAEMSRSSQSPVTYANFEYEYSKDSKSATDIEVDHIWIRVPQMNETSANGVFASNQFEFEKGNGGYLGTQVKRKGPQSENFGFLFDSGVRHRAIFSIWDGDSTHRTVPADDPLSQQNCGRFGGEGTGAHCAIDYPLQQGKKLSVRMQYDGRGVHGDLWSGFLIVAETGERRPLGTLFVPDMDGEGFGKLVPYGCITAFQEYWRATGCDNQALSMVGLIGPYFNDRTLLPARALAVYNHNCRHEDVSSCIPGFGCGKPRILLTGGGKTEKSIAQGQDVWHKPGEPDETKGMRLTHITTDTDAEPTAA